MIATIGRTDQLQVKGRIETLIRLLSRFTQRAMLLLFGNSEVPTDPRKLVQRKFFGTTLGAYRHQRCYHKSPRWTLLPVQCGSD